MNTPYNAAIHTQSEAFQTHTPPQTQRSKYRVGIYTRLSVDDMSNKAKAKSGTLPDESMSVTNQRTMLSAYVLLRGWTEVKVYTDDGWSGSNFDRPAFKEMMEDAAKGIINLILVKDLSRFGRSYVHVGKYTGDILPSLGCRLVALSDGIDTGMDDDEMLSLRSLFNDHYLLDLSKKIKTSHRINAEQGKRVAGRPPYGYAADPADHHGFIVDEYAAGVVRRIYGLRIQGYSYSGIAGILNSEGIFSPREYEYHTFGKEYPYDIRSVWLTRTVKRILNNESYLGHRIQLCSGTASHRLTKIVQKPPEEWVKVENVHEAIIDADTWNAVQAINDEAAKRHTPGERKTSLFKGLLRCADCGSPLSCSRSTHTLKNGSGTVQYTRYQCVRFAQTASAVCSSHSIKEETLKQILLADIRRLSEQIAMDKGAILTHLQVMLNGQNLERHSEIIVELKKVKAKILALEQTETRLYEDKVTGVITEQTFTTLIQRNILDSVAAKDEQVRLLEEQVKIESGLENAKRWISLVEEYSLGIQDVNRDFLDALVERIEVGKAETTEGEKRQDITVYYKYIGKYIGCLDAR